MYNSFFGFRERPFKLVPTPAYLYLSRSHEEALAHLRYAVFQGEGFVEITGEVGTGKTMLCRAFLENLGPEVESAYIFNPRLDARGLLKAINDEFGIRSADNSTKALIDALNDFLMKKKAAGRQVVLIIDEAQNLGKDVLEQLRLLSNLETTRHKLLQMVLVGQPELADVLDSHELRQISQRISLSCRLSPLNFKETGRYIRHRIAVASTGPAVLFTGPALWRIYRYSRGIPRLINIACDRALLVAFSRNTHKITGRIARLGVSELLDRDAHAARRKTAAVPALMLAALAVTLVVLVFYQLGWLQVSGLPTLARTGSQGEAVATASAKKGTENGKPEPSPQAKKENPDSRETLPAALPDAGRDSGSASGSPGQRGQETASAGARDEIGATRKQLSDLVADLDKDSRTAAISYVLSLWHRNTQVLMQDADLRDTETYFERISQRHGLEVHRIENDLERVRKANLPAIFVFSHPKTPVRVYMTAVAAKNRTLTFYHDRTGGFYRIPVEEVGPLWTGSAYVLWENARNIQGVIGMDAEPESVAELQALLRDIGNPDIAVTGDYDADTRAAVKRIQARHGIPVDGYVGPMTKIILYRLNSPDQTPRLAKPNVKDS